MKKELLSAEEYVTGIRSGNRTILSKAITLVESSLSTHQSIAQQIVELCLPYTANSIRIGITGVPGVGKSTFIESLGLYLSKQNKKLAVLAIDPSSQRTKGSILGDKTRMEKLAVDQNAFIRPSPSAGSLGGVARKTKETIVLCEAAGFDIIIVETVGVGQSETAVHSMVDFFLLLMLAGAGDELQGIKRGIMEMADAIIINKADGDNIKNTERARREYLNALHLFPSSESGWTPTVSTCSSLHNKGIEEAWETIETYHKSCLSNGYFHKRRKEQELNIFFETINEKLKENFYSNKNIKNQFESIHKKILSGKISSYQAGKLLLDQYYLDLNKKD
ncbi:MAG: methylmalonyl Co-A mutase-associated GTPase MeaB [Bacteroidales bacterium]|nr:methylmalonyl Co-A mutase-associated GTPase MeaB [Bacteroidales bacterium]MCF8404925.1 methylmalonyl Co-A mutase-associated GTPase MeaB [Bacteroidales bacterium]